MAKLTGGFNTDSDGNIEFEIPILYLYQNSTKTTIEFVYAYDNNTRNLVYEAPSVLPRPTSFSASDGGANIVDLTWVDQSATEDRFRIDRKLSSSGTWDLLDTVGENVESYTDDGSGNLSAPGAESYDYRVRTERDDSSGTTTSDWSTTTIDLTTAAPTMVGISNVTTDSISIEFTDESTNETAFEVGFDDRATGDSSTPTDIIGQISSSTQSGTGTNYTYTDPDDNDAGALSGDDEELEIDYQVRAVTEDGVGPWSGQTRAVQTLPDQVTDLSASNNTTDQINLSWTDISGEEEHYDLRRRVNGGSWTIIEDSLAVNTDSYIDTNVNSSDNYEYEVRGVNSEGVGPWSNTAGPISPVSSDNPENLVPVSGGGAPSFVESDGDGEYYDEVDEDPSGSLDGNTISISASNCNSSSDDSQLGLENPSEPHSTSQNYTVVADVGGQGNYTVVIGAEDTVAHNTETTSFIDPSGQISLPLSQGFVDTLINNNNLDSLELVLGLAADSVCTSNCGEQFEICDLPSASCDRIYLEITN